AVKASYSCTHAAFRLLCVPSSFRRVRLNAFRGDDVRHTCDRDRLLREHGLHERGKQLSSALPPRRDRPRSRALQEWERLGRSRSGKGWRPDDERVPGSLQKQCNSETWTDRRDDATASKRHRRNRKEPFEGAWQSSFRRRLRRDIALGKITIETNLRHHSFITSARSDGKVHPISTKPDVRARAVGSGRSGKRSPPGQHSARSLACQRKTNPSDLQSRHLGFNQ